jgi:NAD(P)H dehydrogenase (quinone)
VVRTEGNLMIVVTAATGHLGRLVVEGLLDAAVPANQITAAVRSPEKAAGLAARGVEVRQADYDDPASLTSALAGADKLLLISSSEVGRRVPQHTAVVDAAKQAGVSHLAYTSILRAEDDRNPVVEHKATEQVISASGIPFTLLRNGWYTENYDAAVDQAAESGVIVGSAGDGRVSSATRADYAAAAVAVLTGEGHEGQVYELAGDVAWTYTELTAAAATVLGRDVAYQNLTPEQHKDVLVGAGLPEPVAGFLVAADQAIAQGALEDGSGTLAKLIGRPTTPLVEGLAASRRD